MLWCNFAHSFTAKVTSSLFDNSLEHFVELSSLHIIATIDQVEGSCIVVNMKNEAVNSYRYLFFLLLNRQNIAPSQFEEENICC